MQRRIVSLTVLLAVLSSLFGFGLVAPSVSRAQDSVFVPLEETQKQMQVQVADVGTCPWWNWRPGGNDYSGSVKIDGLDAPVGTTVEAFNSRNVRISCFRVVYSGWWGILPVFPEPDGMWAGEVIDFRVNGIHAQAQETITGQNPVSPVVWQPDGLGHTVSLELTTPKVTTSVDMPEEVVYGHRPFTITVSVQNVTLQPVDFDSTILVHGFAWGGENGPYAHTPGTQVYWTECGTSQAPDGCRFWWRGTLAPSQTVNFNLPTFSGNTLGSFELLKVDMIAPKPETIVKNVQVVQGSEPGPGGQFTLNTEPWYPGQSRWFKLTLWSPTIVPQFYATTPFTSTCGVQELPTGFYGAWYRSYQEMTWYPHLPSDAPSGPCTISAKIRIWNSCETFDVSYTFQVERPTAVMDADLSVSIANSPEVGHVAGLVTFMVTATNSGPLPADGVQTVIDLPQVEGIIVSSGDIQVTAGNYRLEGARIVWDIGTMAESQSEVLTFVVMPEVAGTITTTVSIAGLPMMGEDPAENNTAVKVTQILQEHFVLQTRVYLPLAVRQ